MVQSPSYQQKKAHNEYHFVPSCRKTKSSPLTWPKNGPSLPPGLVYTQIPNPQFPRYQWVRTHLFAVLGLYSGFMGQLLVYTIKDNGALPRSKEAAVLSDVCGIHHPVE
jgi:hypothetical protein